MQCLASIAGPRFGDYQAGFRFGQLGYELVEQRGLKRFQARTYMNFGSLVMPWTRHVRAGRDLVRRAFEAANQIGDLTFAAYCCTHLNTNLLAAGDPLAEVQREAEHGLAFAQKVRFGLVIDLIPTQLGLIRTLRGLTPKFGSFDDEQFDELRFERRLADNPDLALAECWYWIRKLQARFFAGDYAWRHRGLIEGATAAVDIAVTCSKRRSITSTARLLTRRPAIRAPAERAAAASRGSCRAPPTARRSGRRIARRTSRTAPRWSARRLPGSKAATFDAMNLYEQAIRSARANGFVHNEALANELAARFYAARGFEQIAHLYLRNARDCYLRWGADGKVRQLDADVSAASEMDEPRSGSDEHDRSASRTLDLATVIKVSQAVSGEIVLEKLHRQRSCARRSSRRVPSEVC